MKRLYKVILVLVSAISVLFVGCGKPKTKEVGTDVFSLTCPEECTTLEEDNVFYIYVGEGETASAISIMSFDVFGYLVDTAVVDYLEALTEDLEGFADSFNIGKYDIKLTTTDGFDTSYASVPLEGIGEVPDCILYFKTIDTYGYGGFIISAMVSEGASEEDKASVSEAVKSFHFTQEFLDSTKE